MLTKIKRALISVSDKSGIIEFSRELEQLGIQIISTGGTFQYLIENGVKALEVSDVTQFPEILDGRVKTLHPKIHGAILNKRDVEEHQKQIIDHQIESIDLVCVNLYPFAETIKKPNCSFNDAIENIDIGGPAMIRASAKNYEHVVIVTSPSDYIDIVNEIKVNLDIDQVTRLKLAHKAFSHTAYYDSIISNYLNTKLDTTIHFNQELTIPLKLSQVLRYGENNHQIAAFYKDANQINGSTASFEQLQGKELSYNNIADADSAWCCVKQFDAPGCVIVKHANPCGVAIGSSAIDAYKKAFATDPVSSFGGIIAFNQKVDVDLVELVIQKFLEVLIAPDYSKDALAILANKPNIRVLKIDLEPHSNSFDYKRIDGGVLIQSPENQSLDLSKITVVSSLKPSKEQLLDLEFAWNVAKFVKSNAIVLVKNQQTVGIGAGQMSRIDSTKIAIMKAKEFGFDVTGTVCASDAFFPFRDNVDFLAEAGIKAIIHPGGSIKDQEVFSAADSQGLVMLLTGYRVFRH